MGAAQLRRFCLLVVRLEQRRRGEAGGGSWAETCARDVWRRKLKMPDGGQEEQESGAMVLTFRDEAGREWLAAALVGPLYRYEGADPVPVETIPVSLLKDRPFTLCRITVVDP
jgi:hypothetical protein